MSIKRIYPHLIAFCGFVLIAILYASPVLQGKRLTQHDSVEARAGARESVEYRQKTGRMPLWTNSMFSGMPAYLVSADYPNSITTHLGRFFTSLFPEPVNLIVLYMVGMYILLLTLRVNGWLAALGGVAFAFCSYNIISIAAGHVSKVVAIGYVAPVLSGVILCFRGKYLSGAALTALFLGLQLYGNHLQITYYTFIALLIYGIFELVYAFREKRLRQFGIASATLVLAGLVAVGTHASRLWTTYEYSKSSERGKSELTISPDSTPAKTNDGVSREYAFQWSYGIGETFTLLIPNFYGGGSFGTHKSLPNTVKVLTDNGIPKAQAKSVSESLAGALYWGDQPGTGGPAYAGAIVCFLFVLGMFVIRSGPEQHLKWWALAVIVLFIALAWGKNFEVFNNLMFDYFPGYNKFRAVTMLLNLVQIFMVLVGILGLQEIVNRGWSFEQLKQPLIRSLGVTGGLALIFALAGGLFFNFDGNSDQMLLGQLVQQTQNQDFANKILNGIRDDRASMLRTDAFRSLVFILLAATLIWLFTRKKIKAQLFYAGLIVLVLVDMFPVDKRFFNNDDFKTKNDSDQMFAPTAADQQILQDKDPDFRVLDVTANPFGNAIPSYFHKSAGGYHGAVLGRYQELRKFQLDKSNPEGVLNMLNVKYFIEPGKDGQPVAQRNPGAMGSVWFVNRYQLVPDANSEMKMLDQFAPKQVAFVDKRFEDQLQGLRIQPDSSASIRLTSYAPEQLTYESNAASEQLAVFSEIYYNGNSDWKSFVDGKPALHMRANYVLRAMRIPAGKHTILFKFEPAAYFRGETIALISSVLLLALLAVALVLSVRREKEKQVA